MMRDVSRDRSIFLSLSTMIGASDHARAEHSCESRNGMDCQSWWYISSIVEIDASIVGVRVSRSQRTALAVTRTA